MEAETARIAELGFAVTEREPHGGWGLAAVIRVDEDPIAAATGAGARDTAAVTHEVLRSCRTFNKPLTPAPASRRT